MDRKTAEAIPVYSPIKYRRLDTDFVGSGEYVGSVSLALAQSELHKVEELLAHGDLTQEKYDRLINAVEHAYMGKVAMISGDNGEKLCGFLCEWYPTENPPTPAPF